MDTWALTALVLFLSVALFTVLKTRQAKRLPPGPFAFPILGNLIFLARGQSNFEFVVGDLWSKYGKVITIQLGALRVIMVADRDLAHQMLLQHGSVFADRPSSFFLHTLTANHNVISTAKHGPLWTLLRRNLATEMLSPGRLRRTADSRRWALQILLHELQSMADSADGIVHVRDAFQYAIFSLLVFLCFGERMEEAAVREIQAAREALLSQYVDIAILHTIPKLARPLFRARWKRLQGVQQRQRDVLLPLIKSRRREREVSQSFCYVDSLLALELAEEGGRKLSDEEIVFLCGEFFDGGAETTSTALEWIMANLVKQPDLQEKLFKEVGSRTEEEDLHLRPFLKAVVLEGLRRHPPAQFLITHAAGEEMRLGGYTIPIGVAVNFGVGALNLDEGTWREPLEFRPERFLEGGEGEGVDLTGRKKIQMLTFGAGRRICPGMNLALMELEYFVANLVGRFRWEAVGDVDLSDKLVFTVVMKNPLRARISPR